jgi:hypothetical protein
MQNVLQTRQINSLKMLYVDGLTRRHPIQSKENLGSMVCRVEMFHQDLCMFFNWTVCYIMIIHYDQIKNAITYNQSH